MPWPTGRVLPAVRRVLPALAWLPDLRQPANLRADLFAGLTVALILVPQSMAYAQLAGLPAYYGLFAAFLPPVVAALFGSSRQLATGPVAVVSLLTAASLEPLATAGGAEYIAYAITLALMVGLFQLALGLLRLGVLVNFLSHPVVLGFTNAAAIIIATSQLGNVFGVSVDKSTHHYEMVWRTLVAAAADTHLPTLFIALIAFAIMLFARRIDSRIPGVLIAVVVTTVIARFMDFEQVRTAPLESVQSSRAYFLATDQLTMRAEIERMQQEVKAAEKARAAAYREFGDRDARTLKAGHALDQARFQLERRVRSAKEQLRELYSMRFHFVPGEDELAGIFYAAGESPEETETDGETWRIRSLRESDGALELSAGGQVVGAIPEGLPEFRMPRMNLGVLLELLSGALTIALIGFMEAMSIAKAMAARSRQRLDANQELIGQGLGNVVGSLFQSYPTSGSFSRSAVNIDAGAVTGLSSVVTSVIVVAVLLFGTPLLYHLPQATLSAVIMIAVIGLVNIRGLVHIWRVHWHDGLVAILTFVLALASAPHLARSIMVGVIVSLVLYLYRTMKPRVVLLSRHRDGMLRDADRFNLARCDNITVVRFDGSLYFANTSYFEDRIMERYANKPHLKFVIVECEGINQIDASGEEMLSALAERMRGVGVELLLARMKKQVYDVLKVSGFVQRLGPEHFFARTDLALEYSWTRLGEDHAAQCPLNVAVAAKGQ